MMASFALAILIALHIACSVQATTHLRSGPRARSAAPVKLYGSAVVDDYHQNGRTSALKRIAWAAELKRDIVTWYDLSKDGISIRDCSPTHVTFFGKNVDASDYVRGAVFVIDVADWESNYPPVAVEAGIPEEDDVLFYEIKSAPKVATNGLIKVATERVSGEGVVPEVELGVDEDAGVPAPKAAEGDIEIFSGTTTTISRNLNSLKSPFNPQAALIVAGSVTKSAAGSVPSSNLGIGLKRRISPIPGVTLELDAGASASIRKFKLSRLRSLTFRWEQRFIAEAGVNLSVAKSLNSKSTGRIIEKRVPKFGFRSRRIPFVGRARAGAFVRVDHVLELDAKVKFEADFNIRRELRHKVRASMLRTSASADTLSPLGPQTQTSSLDFSGSASIGGFAGVRPALAIVASLGKKGAAANVGVKLGVEMDVEGRTSSIAFDPFEGAGLKVGVCDRCHVLQGFFGVRIKELALQMERNNRVKREVMLVRDILGVRIATVCAVPSRCSSGTPVRPPMKCKPCKRKSDCPTGFECQKKNTAPASSIGSCIKSVKPGQTCGTCARCTGGSKCIKSSSASVCKTS